MYSDKFSFGVKTGLPDYSWYKTFLGKIYQISINIPNGRKIDQGNVHKIYQQRTLQDPRKFTQIGIFWFENIHTIWQPWVKNQLRRPS
jgi:hypothetical protein